MDKNDYGSRSLACVQALSFEEENLTTDKRGFNGSRIARIAESAKDRRKVNVRTGDELEVLSFNLDFLAMPALLGMS